MPTESTPPDRTIKAKSFLPPINSAKYHLLLGAVTIFILGPLGAVSCAYMNFSLGFFVGGQVLAGILGSVITFGYGSEGKHGANYMQTMAASVANLAGMGILLQAMIWLNLPEPPAWQLILYFTCIGMFGVGTGMLYTPLLVDRMQLTFPSGYAVANILRALTDKTLLKQSIAKLGGGAVVGFVAGFGQQIFTKIGGTLGGDWFEGMSYSGGTIGAGMVVGARIAIPSLVVAAIGYWLTPWLQSDKIGWLQPGEPYKKVGFVIALGTILGAAILDLAIIGYKFTVQLKEKKKAEAGPEEDWKKVSSSRMILWVVGWGIALAFVASAVLHLPLTYVLFALGLTVLFVLVNGIADGISDWNPISSAFVVCVYLMASLGLKDPGVALMCAAIILISCNSGVDMQQDRSTGWRLGTNRVNQFRYQVVGILMGAILAVVLAKLFITAYPDLKINKFDHPNAPGAAKWQSAMTYKFVGAINALTKPNAIFAKAIRFGIAAGFVIELLRKIIKSNTAYKRFVSSSRGGRSTDFILDAFVLSSPYASSFGGFVDLAAVAWFTVGGLAGTLMEVRKENRKALQPAPPDGASVPDDMNAPSLIGGGLIAGDSLSALAVGISSLINTLAGK